MKQIHYLLNAKPTTETRKVTNEEYKVLKHASKILKKYNLEMVAYK